MNAVARDTVLERLSGADIHTMTQHHHLVAGAIRDRRARAHGPRSRQPRHLGMATAGASWKVRHVRDDEFDAWTRLLSRLRGLLQVADV